MGTRKFPQKLWFPPKRKINTIKEEELPYSEQMFSNCFCCKEICTSYFLK